MTAHASPIGPKTRRLKSNLKITRATPFHTPYAHVRMPPNITIPLFAGLASVVILLVLWKRRIIGPRSFGINPTQQRDVWNIPAPIWFVCAAMVFLAAPFVAQLATNLLPASVLGPAKSVRNQATIAAFAYAGALLVAVLLIWFLTPRTSDRSGLRLRPRDALSGALFMLLAAPICLIVAWLSTKLAGLISGTPPSTVAHSTLQTIIDERDTPWAWVLAACAVLGAPIVEEIVYRGFLQSCMLALMERTWYAIIATSALFTAAHVGSAQPHALPTLFVLSIAIGLAYERSRGLLTPIAMHVVFNAANVALAIWSKVSAP